MSHHKHRKEVRIIRRFIRRILRSDILKIFLVIMLFGFIGGTIDP